MNKDVEVVDSYLSPEINIYTNEEAGTLVIQDHGIGMSKEELISNLGIIARSGTSEFAKTLGENDEKDRLIGQFGVGFYSLFMVADRVKVYSRSADPNSIPYCWTSDGSGSYKIGEASGVSRGTKIVMYLKQDSLDFTNTQTVKSVIERYSNFMNYEIKLNGESINKVKALWTMNKNEIEEKTYREFYRFISQSHDYPRYTLHYSGESPIRVQSIFFVPEQHFEKYGLGSMDPGVSLFCRKVLIQHKMKGILPDYLRFIKGVVDSEDIPLNLSRELLQDSSVITRLNKILTRRIIKFLHSESTKDSRKYNEFFGEFNKFIKEGIFSDAENRESLAQLLRMESSITTETDQLVSFDDYVSRMKPDQSEIYYLVSNHRTNALASPYFEGFKKRNLEVLFFYSEIDDGILNYLQNYKGKSIVPIETAKLTELAEGEDNGKGEGNQQQQQETMSAEEIDEFTRWIKDTLVTRVSTVRLSNRLYDSPAIVVDNESASFRRMMRMADPKNAPPLPKQTLEINANHSIMVNLNKIKQTEPLLSRQILEQVFDNALITAGLLDDPRSMISRINDILHSTLSQKV